MNQRYDLLAIGLLFVAAMLAVITIFNPAGFSLKEWQPLTAAIIALGGAGLVYRGAMLNYDAAMKKVDLDREIHEREARRAKRGIFLRLSVAAHIIYEDAK